MNNETQATGTELPSVHGHELIHMVMDHSEGYTMDALKAEIEARFGVGVKFHTCSMQGMPFEHLLYFLMVSGKVVEVEGKLRVNQALICKDGGGSGEHDHDIEQGHGH